MSWVWILIIQLAAYAVMSLFLFNRQRKMLAKQPKPAVKDCAKELTELRKMRQRSLNVPLNEVARPKCLDEIVGQEEGIKALRAALCGPAPQHVIIYGPPGVGKTCAARLILEEAKQNPDSPFDENSSFIEIDATCIRFDERAIADPLIGSVHDPIYQGAGALGIQGVPQPKPGAVCRAHCGVLFLDEIGELHPMQMNKLLKVLEDRKVQFESSYYSKENPNIPQYIHDVFQNGLPADFRLVGATTRRPEELPSALRSRCMELFFEPLNAKNLNTIADAAASRIDFELTPEACEMTAAYSTSGREAVNIVQLASGIAYADSRREIYPEDIEWVARTCRHQKHTLTKLKANLEPGLCIGLGVSSMGTGAIIEIECVIKYCGNGAGSVQMRGAIEEEETETGARRLKRKATARAAAENAISAVEKQFNVECSNYHICFNIPGGIPMDGPSAGAAMFCAVLGALLNKSIRRKTAVTGEITMGGRIKPVGGVREKLQAAVNAGAEAVIIPKANYLEEYEALPLDIYAVESASEITAIVFTDAITGVNTEAAIATLH